MVGELEPARASELVERALRHADSEVLAIATAMAYKAHPLAV